MEAKDGGASKAGTVGNLPDTPGSSPKHPGEHEGEHLRLLQHACQLLQHSLTSLHEAWISMRSHEAQGSLRGLNSGCIKQAEGCAEGFSPRSRRWVLPAALSCMHARAPAAPRCRRPRERGCASRLCPPLRVLNHSPAAGAPMLRNGGGAAPSQDSEDGGVGFDRPDHAAVFDLSMDSDDDVLLDWEAYAGASWHQ